MVGEGVRERRYSSSSEMICRAEGVRMEGLRRRGEQALRWRIASREMTTAFAEVNPKPQRERGKRTYKSKTWLEWESI